MGFKVIYSGSFFFQLKKLGNDNAKRALDKIKQSSEKPMHFFDRLVGSEECRLRVGDYRLIAEINYGEKAILVKSIGYRSNVYKRK